MSDTASLPPHKQRLVDSLAAHWDGLESQKTYFDAKPWGVEALDRAIGELKELAQLVAQRCPIGDALERPRPPRKKKRPATPAKPGRKPAKPSKPGGRKKTPGRGGR